MNPDAKDQPRVDPALAAGNRTTLAGYRARHFEWSVADARRAPSR